MAMTVADHLLERLREWGIHRVFGYPADGINGIVGALRRAGNDPQFIQARHGEMAASMACAERVLLPAFREASPAMVVVADGFSCRTQIAQAADCRALHTAEVLSMALHRE